MHAVRLAHLDLPDLQGEVDRRARSRTTRGPPPDGHVFKAILNIPVTSQSTFVLLMSSLAMVLALAAVENRGKPGYVGHAAGQLEVLARRHGGARRDLPRLPGVRVHVVRARRADDPHQPVRLVVLHAHRLPRRARDGRRALAADAALDRHQARAARRRTRCSWTSARCTGTSSTSSGSRSSRSSTSSSESRRHMNDHAPHADHAHEHPTLEAVQVGRAHG